MNTNNLHPNDDVPPSDDLDALLRKWHQVHAAKAKQARDRILDKVLASAHENPSVPPSLAPSVPASRSPRAGVPSRQTPSLWRSLMTRYSPIAAVFALLAILIPTILTTGSRQQAKAQDVIMAPDGGRLDALDTKGTIIGPCPLKGTDVDVAISGRFTRVTLKQKFHNPYPDKIEAVYTFPMSHRAAVDQMVMTVGDRVVVGEVKEREQARRIYEAAREQGHVASLLEQERPNIFTQSVANIEPGAEIDVQISYVELLDSKDGTFTFDFPMVVGPRYIPGTPKTSLGDLSGNYKRRTGLILIAPGNLAITEEGPEVPHKLTAQQLTSLVNGAIPIESPGGNHRLWYNFQVTYPDGSKEPGSLCTDGTGYVGAGNFDNRWFCIPKELLTKPGEAFSPDTNQVPDASKITPMPVRPDQRSGHDISISVAIDTGGPGILDLKSALHDVIQTKKVQRDDGTSRKMTVELKKEREIPNRDFVLTWRQTADTIEEATFTHTGKHGNFFSLILQPPARVTDAQAVARELVFVLDTSGSMSGFPIEKAKEVMTKAIGALRPQDTFNLITFSGDTHILWKKPRPATKENIEAAQQFLANRQGGGGTEMMKAIEAALEQPLPSAAMLQPPAGAEDAISPDALANLPADGRDVSVLVDLSQMTVKARKTIAGPASQLRELTVRRMEQIRLDDETLLDTNGVVLKDSDPREGQAVLKGHWSTKDRRRILEIKDVIWPEKKDIAPMRICCFMTDGYVGNDQAIIDAVKQNAKTTRVFSFGIGNSVNRYLLDGMARAGRGEVEYVLLQGDADAAAKRFAQRIQTPVLTDIELTFSNGLKVVEMVPKTLPDLFDVKPLILHGRYTTPGTGTLTVRGRTGSGKYERTIPLDLPASQPEHDTIATLWARAKVEELMNEDLGAAQTGQFPKELHDEVVRLGETFGIMTQYTSFVAVEKQRVTIGGQPRLVHVPIEMPQGVSYEGVFGDDALSNLISQTALTIQTRLAAQQQFVQYQKDRDDRVAQLMERAVQFQKERQYEKSVDALDEALMLNPDNNRARFMKQVIEDTNKISLEKRAEQKRRDKMQENSHASMEALVPDTVGLNKHAMKYPGVNDLRLTSERDPFGSGGTETGGWGYGGGQSRFCAIQNKPVNSTGSTVTNLWTMGYSDGATPGTFALPSSTDADGDGLPELNAGARFRGEYYWDTSSAERAVAAPYLPAPAVSIAEESEQPNDVLQLDPKPLYTFPLQYSDAETAAKAVNTYLAGTPDGGNSVEIEKDGRANRLLVKATPAVRAQIVEFLNRVDCPLAPTSSIRVYAVPGIEPTKAAEIIKQRMSRTETQPAADTIGVTILPPSDALIVSANAERQKEIAKVVESLAAEIAATRPASPPLEERTQREVAWLTALSEGKRLDWAREQLVPQRLTIQIGELANAGKLDDAKALAEALAQFDAEFKIGTQMRDALNDSKLTAADRDRRIAALADEAKKAFDPIINKLKLRDRLDQRLYPLVTGGPAAATQPAPEGVHLTNGQVQVTVLATDTQRSTLDAFHKAGLQIDAKAEKTRLVVGRVPREQLADLALLDQVRRVEPTEQTD